MGNTSSTNIVDNAVQATVEIINQAMQDCSTQMRQDQLVHVKGNNNVTEGIDFSQMMSADISCTQETQISNEIQQTIDQEMQQRASAIMGAISLNPGSADASNIMKGFVDLGTAVHSNFTQRCASALTSTQALVVEGDGNVTRFLSYKQAADILKRCSTDSHAVTKAKQDLKQKISQIAKAEKKGIDLMFLAVIFLGLIGLVGVGGTTVLTNKYVIMGVLAAGAAYLGVAFYTKSGPFQKKDPPPAPPGKPTPEAGEAGEDPKKETGKESYYTHFAHKPRVREIMDF